MKSGSKRSFARLRIVMLLFMLLSTMSSFSLPAAAAPGNMGGEQQSLFQVNQLTLQVCLDLDADNSGTVTAAEVEAGSTILTTAGITIGVGQGEAAATGSVIDS